VYDGARTAGQLDPHVLAEAHDIRALRQCFEICHAMGATKAADMSKAIRGAYRLVTSACDIPGTPSG